MSATATKAKAIDLTQDKTWVFQLTQKVTPRGTWVDSAGKGTGDTDPPYPNHKKIRNPVLVYDEETKRTRWARLLRGYNTIWMDEQDEKQKLTDAQVASILQEVVFSAGKLFAKTPMDALLVRFLTAHDDNAGKDNRISGKPAQFELVVDKSAVEDELIDLEMEAMEKADGVKNINDVKAHGSFLNIKTRDENGLELSEKAIRVEYKKAARKNPKLFLATLNNPATKAGYMVRQAVTAGVIDLHKVKGQAHWADSGALIVPIDPMKDAVEFLTEFSVSGSDEGNDFLKRLEQLSKKS